MPTEHKIKMRRTVTGAANAAGSVSMDYEKGHVYPMDEPWQRDLAKIFVEEMEAAHVVTTRGRGRPSNAEKAAEAAAAGANGDTADATQTQDEEIEEEGEAQEADPVETAGDPPAEPARDQAR